MRCEWPFDPSTAFGDGIRGLGAAERAAVEGRYVHERDYWTIGRLAGKNAEAVRAAHFVAIRKLRLAFYRNVLGLCGPTVVFLSAYYAENPSEYSAASTDDLVRWAQEHAGHTLGLAASEVASRHVEIMKALAAKARQWELHRRDPCWRVIVSRYSVKDLTSYLDECVAIRAVLSSLDL